MQQKYHTILTFMFLFHLSCRSHKPTTINWKMKGCKSPRLCYLLLAFHQGITSHLRHSTTDELSTINQKAGLFFWGLAPKSSPFGGGTMCVQGPLRRSAQLDSGGTTGQNCTGSYSFAFTHAYMAAQGLTPGTAVFGQFWSRDPLHPDNSTIGLTGGISFVVRP